ncbi:phoenix [Colossoma macropomum]|uniref:phoenix n=1 Tax=Colossoma macropomum TaxID=42526 RepID=UPI001864E5AA|nr:phoenix [Colossoma macropomum]
MPSILELLMQSELVQLDSQTDVFFETPPTDVISEEFSEATVSGFSGSTAKPPLLFSDSDSGDSLFLTQSVTSAHRTVKRCRSSERTGPIPRGEPDNHLSDDDLFGSPLKVLPLPEKRAAGSCSQPRKRRPAPARPKRREFPFLPKSSSGKLSVHKSQTLMNSEIGGFFKCIYYMNTGRGKRRRRLSSDFLPSAPEEGSAEEDHDDIRIVDLASFISNCPKRNRQTWLPASRWKSRQASSTAPKKDNKRKKEKIEDKKKQNVKKNSPVSMGAKGKRKAQENTETLSDTAVGSLNVRTLRSKSRKQENKSRTSFSSPGCSSVRSLLIEQEQHSEKQLEVLVACTQSESLDLLCSNTQSCENLALEGANDDTVVEETQRPDLDQASEDSDRTPSLEMLQEELRERDEDGMYETSKEKNVEIFVGVETSSHADNTEHCELQKSSQSYVPHLIKTTSTIADEIKQAEDKDHNKTPADDSVTLACPERNVHFLHLTLSLSDDLSGLEVNADSSPSENVITGEQAEMARGTVHSQMEDPEQVEATEVMQHSEQEATESVSATKVKEKKRKRAQTGEDDVAVIDGQVETAEDVAVIQHSELQSVELVPEEKMKKKRRKELVGEGDVVVEASQLESTAQIEAVEVIQHSEKQATEFVPEKKIKKREQVGEDDVAVETSQLETPPVILDPEGQAAELVPEKKLKRKKKNRPGVVEENVAVEASQADNTAQVEATEVVQHSEHQDTESVPEKTLEKKKKRERVVESFVALETSQVAATEQAETLEVVQDSQQQSSQSFPEKKVKKKKKNHREQVVEENVVLKASQVGTTEQDVIQDSEPQATELVSEKKVKKKKKRPGVIEENVAVEATQIETTEQVDALEVIRDSEQQATDLGPEKKLKKKKKKAGIVQENVAVEISQVETTQQPDALEVIWHSEQQATELALEKKHKKKKKKKAEVVEENMAVYTSLIDTTEQVEAVEVIQDSEPQVTEFIPEKKHKKKKKKKSRDVEENVAVETPEQVEAVEVIQDSEPQAPESDPETKLKKKKKKKKKKSRAGLENVDMEQVASLEMVQDCEQKPSEQIPEKKLKKIKDRTSHDSEVAHEGKARKTPWVAFENASISNRPGSLTISNPSIPGMETNVSEQDNSSEINEEVGYCSPCVGGSAFPKKKKKKRKEKENNALSWVSDGMGRIDQEEFGQRHKGKSSVAQLESSAWPFSDKTGKNKRTSLFSDSESGHSLLQSEDTVQLETKKKKNKRQAEAATDVSAGLYDEDAEYVASQESLRGSQSTPSEALSEKRKKKKIKRDNFDSGQNVGGIRHMQYVHSLDITTGLERVESPQEVSSTQLGEEDSIPSSGGGLFMNSEKKKKKKKKSKE